MENWQTKQTIENTNRNTHEIINQIKTVKTQTEWLLQEVMKSAKTLTKLCDEVQKIQTQNGDSL